MRKLSVIISLCLLLEVFGCSPEVSQYVSKQNSSSHLQVTEESIKQNSQDITFPQITGLDDQAKENTVNNLLRNQATEFVKSTLPWQDKTFYGRYKVQYQDKNILSVYYTESINAEKVAHPANMTSSVTINLNTGEKLTLDNLFKVNSGYSAILLQDMEKQVKEKNLNLFEALPQPSGSQDFYITSTSLVLYFQPAVYTPDYYGVLEFAIPLDSLKELLNTDLLT